MAKRITTQDLHCEVEQVKKDITLIKDNHLAHMAQDIDELRTEIKESRTFFHSRLDRLDNKIMWILGILLTTTFSALVAMIAGVV
jgi:hypothetical protein